MKTLRTKKPSLRYRFVKSVVNAVGRRSLLHLPEGDIRALWAGTYKGKRVHTLSKIEPPKRTARRLRVRREDIDGTPCFIAAPQGTPAAGTVLLLHGGAFLHEAISLHWRMLRILVRKKRMSVWLPAYPHMPAADPEGSARAVLAVYAHMLKSIPPETITVQGDSAGAALALALGHILPQAALPMPAQMILVSPGQFYMPPALVPLMEKCAKTDVISMTLLTSMNALAGTPDALSPALSRGLEGDFSAFPPLAVFVGTGEMLYPPIARLLARNPTAKITLHEGKGMCHIYPYFPCNPESRAALKTILSYLP
ncbi:MAG: alpha/beta hydrolase [Clostridiales bacterium]|jgi:acetyl esterase/lipase|nr:alpha/beta hydrolase [Clostridiales bacterium]